MVLASIYWSFEKEKVFCLREVNVSIRNRLGGVGIKCHLGCPTVLMDHGLSVVIVVGGDHEGRGRQVKAGEKDRGVCSESKRDGEPVEHILFHFLQFLILGLNNFVNVWQWAGVGKTERCGKIMNTIKIRIQELL